MLSIYVSETERTIGGKLSSIRVIWDILKKKKRLLNLIRICTINS